MVLKSCLRRKERSMIRKISAAVIAIGFLASQATAAQAEGLYFRNSTSEPVYIAAAYSQRGGWRIIGWYRVEPARTVQVLNGALDQRYYYYYAVNGSRTRFWDGKDGNDWFYLHPTRQFSILRMGGVYHNMPDGAEMEGFRQI